MSCEKTIPRQMFVEMVRLWHLNLYSDINYPIAKLYARNYLDDLIEQEVPHIDSFEDILDSTESVISKIKNHKMCETFLPLSYIYGKRYHDRQHDVIPSYEIEEDFSTYDRTILNGVAIDCNKEMEFWAQNTDSLHKLALDVVNGLE